MDKPAPEDTVKTRQKRARVLQELVETESTFVQNLHRFITTYIEHFRLENSEVKKDFAGNARVALLFANIEQIHSINSDLLQRLKERVNRDASSHGTDDGVGSTTPAIGDVFNDFAPLFNLYAQYTANHAKASQVLRDFETRSEFGKLILDLQQTFIAEHGQPAQPLGSYLIMPVQRVPRYNLLLKEIYKFTPESHPDRDVLRGAIESVQHAATLINETIRGREEQDRLVRLESMFVEGRAGVPSLAKEGRRLVKEGRLVKRCRNSNREYYFHLFTDILLYSKPKSGDSQFVLHRQIELKFASVGTEKLVSPLAFSVVSKEKSFVVFAPDEEKKNEWVEAIDGCIVKSLQAAKRKRKLKNRRSVIEQSAGMGASHRTSMVEHTVVKAKMWVPDDEGTDCMVCHKEFNVVRRRHHCRNCGGLVCDSCSGHRLFLPNVGSSPVRACDNCVAEADKTELNALRLELHVLQAVEKKGKGSSLIRSSSSPSVMSYSPYSFLKGPQGPQKLGDQGHDGEYQGVKKRIRSFMSFRQTSSTKKKARLWYAKVFLNDRLYGQTEAQVLDGHGKVRWGEKGVHFDISIPRIMLGSDEAGRQLFVNIEIFEIGLMGNARLVGTSQLKVFEVFMKSTSLRRTMAGELASQERRDGKAQFHAFKDGRAMRETFDGVVEIMNPMVARAESKRAAELFPSGIVTLPTVRQREIDDPAWGGGDIIEVCGQVEVSLGIIAPTALESNKTVLGVTGWLKQRFDEFDSKMAQLPSWSSATANDEGEAASANEQRKEEFETGTSLEYLAGCHAMQLLFGFSQNLVDQIDREDEESDDDEDDGVGEEKGSQAKAARAEPKRSRESKTIDQVTDGLGTVQDLKQKFYARVKGGKRAFQKERRGYLEGLKGKVVQLDVENLSQREIHLCNILRSEDEYSQMLDDLIERLVDPSLAIASGANVSVNTIGSLGTASQRTNFGGRNSRVGTRGRNTNIPIPARTIVALNALKQIHTLNKELLKTLTDAILVKAAKEKSEKRDKQFIVENACVGNLFDNFGTSFKIYADFAANFGDFVKSFNEMPSFAAVMNAFRMHLFTKLNITEQSDEDIALKNLREVLNRLSVYRDLLIKFRDNIDAQTDPDYNDLVQAIKKIDDAASHIAATNHKRENKEALIRIGKSFDPPIDMLVKDREFIRSGNLVKVCRRVNKEFYFFLFNDVLVYSHWKVAVGKFAFNREIQLSKCRVNELETIGGGANKPEMVRFTIESENKSFVALAPIEEGRSWIEDLKRHIAAASTEEAASSGELVIAPVWNQDSSSSSCEICQTDFHMILRRRHHCRKCGRLVCGKCSPHREIIATLSATPSRVCTICFEEA
eukprot:g353.t1